MEVEVRVKVPAKTRLEDMGWVHSAFRNPGALTKLQTVTTGRSKADYEHLGLILISNTELSVYIALAGSDTHDF